MSDPQFNSVNTNSLESVRKGKKMKPKEKLSSNDGDGSHWESAREKEKAMKAPRSSGIYVQPSKARAKKISASVADSGRTEKYMGKRKPVRKPSVKK
jgi:hypothetical protein